MTRLPRTPTLGITGLFVAFLLVASVTPVLLIGYVSYRLAQDRLNQQAGEQVHELLKARIEYLNAEFSQIENLATNLRSVDAIISVLSRPSQALNAFDRLSTQANIGYALNSYLGIPGIISIDIFSETSQHFHVGDTLDAASVRQEVRDSILKRTEQHPGVVYWAGVEPNINRLSPHETVLAATSLLWTVDAATLQPRRIGMLVINYDLEQVQHSLSRLKVGRAGYLIALD